MKRSLSLRIGTFLIALLLLTGGLHLNAEETAEPVEELPEIGAENAVIFNADDAGEILYGKNETQLVYCGFLSRVMTCILIAESGKIDENATVTTEALINTPQVSTVQLKAGDQLTYRDLMHCICVANAQEAAVTAALGLEGNLKDFVQRMNEKAAELGAENTLFTNVTGKHVSNTKQITTLEDCAKIISAALQYPEIAEAAVLRTAKITVNGKTRNLYTRNMLIEPTSSQYSASAKGLFIYSENTSNSSIATYRKDSDRRIISLAVTTQGLESLYKDAAVLLDYSKNRYASRTLLTKGSALHEVSVHNGKDVDFVVLISGQDITALVPKIYNKENVRIEVTAPKSLEAPVEKGTVIGSATVFCGGKEYGTVELKAQSTVELDYFELYSEKMMEFFSNAWLWVIIVGTALLVGGYILLTYLINRPRKKKKSNPNATGGRIRMTGGEEDED